MTALPLAIAFDPSPAEALSAVDGQAISVRDRPDALRHVESRLEAGVGFTLFTLNMDHLVKRRQNAGFRDLYARATFVTADGWPVVHLARRENSAVDLATGADLVVPLCHLAARRLAPIYLFGSEAPVLAAAASRLRVLCPGLAIAGQAAPAFGFDPVSDTAEQAAARIAASGARLCFVALGAPKQEMFADAARAICPGVGFICIGAGLDFIAGARSRAPRIVQKIRLEWAWRVALEPRRLGLRYLRCGLLFARLLIRSAI